MPNIFETFCFQVVSVLKFHQNKIDNKQHLASKVTALYHVENISKAWALCIAKTKKKKWDKNVPIQVKLPFSRIFIIHMLLLLLLIFLSVPIMYCSHPPLTETLWIVLFRICICVRQTIKKYFQSSFQKNKFFLLSFSSVLFASCLFVRSLVRFRHLHICYSLSTLILTLNLLYIYFFQPL